MLDKIIETNQRIPKEWLAHPLNKSIGKLLFSEYLNDIWLSEFPTAAHQNTSEIVDYITEEKIEETKAALAHTFPDKSLLSSKIVAQVA